jgi:hypothetical protein
VPNGLIVLIVVVLALLLFGGFMMLRFGPPKDARRRQVKDAQAKARRAAIALRDIEHKLLNTVLLDDLVASDMRQTCLQIINNHRDQELEIEAK